ncbi:MAG: putative O-methyltransferase YrrM [Candidatus Krumholzibacteriia bacterium]|jgi:predicted O-methyltransferase YrrM
MSDKCLSMSKELYNYTLSTSLRESPALVALREETGTLEMARMQISPDQGQFMAMLVKMLGAKKVVEVGTFTGYSALVVAEATEPDAKIYCCDVSEEWTSIARRHWQASGLGGKIDLRLAPATETLADLLTDGEGTFDFAFIDADKSNYDAYYESCLKLLRSGGIIAVDNYFWGGDVADESKQDDDTKAIRALNTKMKSDERVDLSIVPIGDGVALARKR